MARTFSMSMGQTLAMCLVSLVAMGSAACGADPNQWPAEGSAFETSPPTGSDYALGQVQQAVVNSNWVVGSGVTGTPLNTVTVDSIIGTDAASNFAFSIWVHGTRGLRIAPTAANIPNLIGGYSGNVVTTGAVAVAIGGGGASTHVNTVTDDYSYIGGGYHNRAGNNNAGTTDARWAVVAGGSTNTANGEQSAVVGGFTNTASAPKSFVGGGSNNTTNGIASFVGGGTSNSPGGLNGVVVGGSGNSAIADYGFIGGGQGNMVDSTATHAVVGGGFTNTASGQFSTIAGGENNRVPNTASFVGGGNGNHADGALSAIGGGSSNSTASVGTNQTVGGGSGNVAIGAYTTVAGGLNNNAGNQYTAVVGGSGNGATADHAFVGGGLFNQITNATANYAVIGGGNNNSASGAGAAIPGGQNNIASGVNSFSAGQHASADTDGCFVSHDNSSTTAQTCGGIANRFVARVDGGAIFYSNAASNLGVVLAHNGTSFAPLSDRNAKRDIVPLNAQDVLARFAEMPLYTWTYKADELSQKHMGPMAQDFHAAFGLGGEDEKHIATLDADGVIFGALKGLHEKITRIEAENHELKRLGMGNQKLEQLEAENRELKRRLDRLEATRPQPAMGMVPGGLGSSVSRSDWAQQLSPGAGRNARGRLLQRHRPERPAAIIALCSACSVGGRAGSAGG